DRPARDLPAHLRRGYLALETMIADNKKVRARNDPGAAMFEIMLPVRLDPGFVLDVLADDGHGLGDVADFIVARGAGNLRIDVAIRHGLQAPLNFCSGVANRRHASSRSPALPNIRSKHGSADGCCAAGTLPRAKSCR